MARSRQMGRAGQAARAYIKKPQGTLVVLIGVFVGKLNRVREIAIREAPGIEENQGLKGEGNH